jgi:hypothetical protein
MRRLTLILSDLYLPEDHVHGEVPHTHELPAFEWLLGRADRPVRIGDWRHWLLSTVHSTREHGPSPSVAQVCADAAHIARGRGAWIATPVSLEARLDHVRLADRGLLRLEPEERSPWCAAFARDFGPEYGLHECGARAFVLTGLAPSPTADPARLLGSGIDRGLPGRESAEARRLWAEIEMWLHASPLNAARERAGRPRVSALWLWGASASAAPLPGQKEPASWRWLGEDPLIVALSGPGAREPRSFSPFGAPPGAGPLNLIAEFAPLTGMVEETLPMLEAQWFAPAVAALSRGEIDDLTIIANDRLFRIGKGARWRFWKSRRHWLELLASAGTKA